MDLKPDFVFKPLPPIPHPVPPIVPPLLPIPVPPPSETPLGPLQGLLGKWTGTGFNTIWRPNRVPGDPAQDRFLELNLTDETIEFIDIPGEIPNRGLLQPDIKMFGVRYLQQIQDRNNKAGLHIEPGIWARVPITTNPAEGETVVRMASIPHGTTVLAQGVSAHVAGPPPIEPVDITPFLIGNSAKKIHFPESNLSIPTAFRSPPADIVGISQAMVDNPNSVLVVGEAPFKIVNTVVLIVSSSPKAPVLGGGTSNTAFLQGGTAGPNAQAALVDAIFWIMQVEDHAGHPQPPMLQYTQTVLLNFNGLSWPHVSVATLRKVVPPSVA